MPHDSSYADLEHADRLLTTASYLIDRGFCRAATDILEVLHRERRSLGPEHREELSALAIRIVGRIHDRPLPVVPVAPSPELSWDEEESPLKVC